MMSMNKETIRIEELSIGYSAKNSDVKIVASHINASIHSAQLTCLLGANGVGKSTLLSQSWTEKSTFKGKRLMTTAPLNYPRPSALS